jgi:hypothetical protein
MRPLLRETRLLSFVGPRGDDRESRCGCTSTEGPARRSGSHSAGWSLCRQGAPEVGIGRMAELVLKRTSVGTPGQGATDVLNEADFTQDWRGEHGCAQH